MPTPHNSAQKGQIADVVLMPGDPMRAKLISDTYLTDVEVSNGVRGIYAYTGNYKGRRISVMASGMGMPSLGIYAYELYTEYDVETIIRVGTAGSYVHDLRVKDVFIADAAYSESSFAKVQSGYESDTTYASPEVIEKLKAATIAKGKTPVVGTIHSADVFYRLGSSDYQKDVVENHNCMCVEMESFALYATATALGKKAACLCTISDSFVDPEILTPEERQNNLHTMLQIALDSCLL